MPPKNKVEPDGNGDVESGGGIDNPAVDLTSFTIPVKSDDVASFAVTAEGTTVLDPENEKAGESQMESVRDKPYAGMGKEDLLRFSDTDFWNRFRLISIIVFWVAWLVLLATVIGLTIVAPRCGDRPTPEWWQKSVIYQVYVRSFYDSDDDGMGDIKGVIAKLDHIVDLKANAILLSSMYQSSTEGLPDYGYEVTNHRILSTEYGFLDDLQTLIEAANNKSIAVILDFIPNYTGKDHQWFVDRSDNYTNPYWNYYVWANCNPPTFPNNWRSMYGTEAWTWDDEKRQCYLHQFLDTQPELNLRSAAVQNELEEILRFWLNKGVNGFRINSAAYLFENPDFQGEEIISGCSGDGYECLNHTQTKSLPEVYDIIKRWRSIVDEYRDKNESNPLRTRILLSDGDVSVSDTIKYYGTRGDGANLPINYMFSHVNQSCNGKCINGLLHQWIHSLPADATTAWLVSDQDRSRIQSVLGQTYANALTLLTMTLPGTALIYYGDEIGMKNFVGNTYRDPAGNFSMSRDQYRAPMQWGNGTHANFSSGSTTWLDVDDASKDSVNVEYPGDASLSSLNLVKELSSMRASRESLQYGQFHFVEVTDENLVAYVREHEGFDRLLTVINFGNKASGEVDFTKASSGISIPSSADILLETNGTRTAVESWSVNLRAVKLDPGAGFIAQWAYSRP